MPEENTYADANAGQTYKYAANGTLTSETNRLGKITKYFYNDIGSKVREEFDIYKFYYLNHGELLRREKHMNCIYYGYLSLILVPLIIILWVILFIYKLIDQKVNFDKEGGVYVRLKFDYELLLFVLIFSSFGMAIASFKEAMWFSLVIVLLLFILSAGIVMYYVCNKNIKKNADSNKRHKLKKRKISAIIVTIAMIFLEIISYVFWQIS